MSEKTKWQPTILASFLLFAISAAGLNAQENSVSDQIEEGFLSGFESRETASRNQVNALESEEGVLYVDRMKRYRMNALGGRNSVYVRAPSGATFDKGNYGRGDNKTLRIRFSKKAYDGPYGQGGWCGFYTILKNRRLFSKNDGFLDASKYNYITFWVKSETGEENENFCLGVADKMWSLIDDSMKTEPIGNYLPEGRLTTEWQLAVIPLHDVFIDWSLVNSLAICFEGDLFEDGEGGGTIYIDDIAFRVEEPDPRERMESGMESVSQAEPSENP